MVQLSAEQASLFSEAFCFIDRDGDGVISAKEVGVAMRSAGENVSEEEVQEMVKSADKGVDLQTFLQMAKSRNVNGNGKKKTEENLLKAFRFLDRNQTGNIYVGELRHLLTTVGEKLSGDEFDRWIDQESDCDSNGRINFEILVKKLMCSDK